uniref:Uncharacterized protein n=1 Tax=Cannabis sativa TaxID=3483 RepID=A0A803P9L0_CANSA
MLYTATIVTTRTTITKPASRDGDTTMDDVNPPPTTHENTGVVGDGEMSENDEEYYYEQDPKVIRKAQELIETKKKTGGA